MVVPKNSLILGVPGKIIKQDTQFMDMIRKNAEIYQKLSQKHKQGTYSIVSSKK
jgi:carbonic anhydrase/acetyltransferase-like protein (isoleucine patch superfamily)